MRKTNFVEGEFYHIYNRGVDKRNILQNESDAERFLLSLVKLNAREPIGSLYELSFAKETKQKDDPLVSLVAYCLNPNHYHLILSPILEKGVETFMQRLGTGYTMYFNQRYGRSGSLFQGRFKATHIDSNEYFLHVSAYVNLNDKTHQLGGSTSKLVRSSWNEYLSKPHTGICQKNIILEQFRSPAEYREFALSSLNDIIERKNAEKEIQNLLID